MKEINILEKLTVMDFRAICKALCYNPWFTALVIDFQIKEKEIWEYVGEVLEVGFKVKLLSFVSVIMC
jgi:hypothetical protein